MKVAMKALFKVCSRAAAAFAILALLLMFGAAPSHAQDTTISISIKNHRFEPAEISAPAGKRIVLRIKNLDPTPMEFESVTLRVEKVVPGNSEGVINLRPLEPGSYKFFDDFNKSAAGVLVVK
jgi:Cupredoxin-like domain